jgi:hypothetical protein
VEADGVPCIGESCKANTQGRGRDSPKKEWERGLLDRLFRKAAMGRDSKEYLNWLVGKTSNLLTNKSSIENDSILLLYILAMWQCYYYLAGFLPFGAKMAIILLPSSFGKPSKAPTSARRSANFSSSNWPLSWNMMARPLNCT